MILSHACLPIPALPRNCKIISESENCVNNRYNLAEMLINSYIMEGLLSRIINPEGLQKREQDSTRAIVLALRELMRQTEPDQTAGIWRHLLLLPSKKSVCDG